MTIATAHLAVDDDGLDAHLSDVITRLKKGKVVKVGTANPKALAEMIIGIAERGRRDIHFYQGDPYVYTGTHYIEMDGGDYAGKVTRIIERKYQRQTLAQRERLRQLDAEALADVNLEKQVVARPVTEGVVRDVVASIRANTLVPADAELPMFIEPRGFSWRSINVANGIIHLDKLMAEGSTPIWTHRPQFFSLTCLPFAYDPAATCPQWEDFLNYVLEGDQERIALLQEYFGYFLIAGNKYQKFLMLEGVGGNGKGVTAAVLQEMLGSANVSNVGLEKFSQRFQLAPTRNKLLNVCSEWTQVKAADESELKKWVGEDILNCDRKNKSAVEWRATAKILVLTNKRPKVHDDTEGFWRRMLVLPFNVRIPKGRQDPEFKAKLLKELPGVFNWAMAGLRRLEAQQGFTISAQMTSAIEEFRQDDSPERAFATERLLAVEDADTAVRDVYTAYEDWCEQRNEKNVLTDREFNQAIRRMFEGVSTKPKRDGDKVIKVWVGLHLMTD